MLGYVIKLIVLIVVVMIGLNIYAPQRVDDILGKVSNATNIEQNTLQNNLDSATKFIQDTVSEVTDTVKKNLE